MQEEVAVCCPFPHTLPNGQTYQESHPSAHINLHKRTFHCKVCGEGMSEVTLISKLLECSFGDAVRFSKVFNNDETLKEWKACTSLEPTTLNLAKSLGISEEVAKELHLSGDATSLQFPVFLQDKLLDIRTYTPGGTPKIKSRKGAMAGLLLPYDRLKEIPLEKTILLCAGEKDMATTRSHGFEAFTITGGETCLPVSLKPFKNRHVVILYDNDETGRLGANKLAKHLSSVVASVKVCTAFHKVCAQPKEDMTDYWNKYNGTSEQLIQFMDSTPEYQSVHEETLYTEMTLAEATNPKNICKVVTSNVQVVAVNDAHFLAPAEITALKTRASDNSSQDTMYAGEVREWRLTETTAQDILHLIDGGFKENDLHKHKRFLMRIPLKENHVQIKDVTKEVVYKGVVTDMFESMHTDSMPVEYQVYSIGTRLESGQKYRCTYKLVPHPYKGQQLIMIVMNAVPATDSVSKFKITPEVKANLRLFQELPGTIEEKMHTLVQKFKGKLGYDGNDLLIQVMDLAYHTPLLFHFGRFQNVRGYLDTLIIGESRVGKSSTAECMRNTYQLGAFTSLAGNSATIPGLIGGSSKTSSGSFQTKAGLLPQNHKGLIIFEEFGKCNNNLITELTDIRSSNEVRITRVSGVLKLPAMVRMITLSNVKASGSTLKPINSYPNGLAIVTELVGAAEDIARYDVICVIGEYGATQIDPFWTPQEPMEDQAYWDRVRWVWSRTPDQIQISQEVGAYLMEQANQLNMQYDTHIKLFGTEAWKKIARVAIAMAGYTVSTDESFEHVIVTKECVDCAVALLQKLYVNDTFRLQEYVAAERRLKEIDAEGIALLQQIFIKVPQMLIALEQDGNITKSSLTAIAGVDQTVFNFYTASLIRGGFVRMNGMEILPTERFRKGMKQINRTAGLTKLGETNA